MLTLFVVASTYITWPQFLADVTHSGIQTQTGGITVPMTLWQNTTFTSPTRNGFVIDDVDGDGQMEVVTVNSTGTVYCFDGMTGAIEWTAALGGSWNNAQPACADLIPLNNQLEIVLKRNGGDNLYCLLGSSGATAWTAMGTASSSYGGGCSIGDAVPGNGYLEVLWGDGGGNVRCTQGNNGALLWTATPGGGQVLTPAMGDLVPANGTSEVAVTGSPAWGTPGWAAVLRSDNGAVIWSQSFNESCRSAPAIADLVPGNGVLEVVYATEGSATGVRCHRGDNGALLWSNNLNYTYNSSTAVGDLTGDGIIDVLVSACTGAELRCIRGSDGVTQWSYALGSCTGGASPAIVDIDNDGAMEVISSSDNGFIHCVSSTGIQEWTYSFRGGQGLDPSIAVGDVDADTCVEIAVQGWSPVSVFIIDGTLSCSPTGVGVGEGGGGPWVRLVPVGLSGSIRVSLAISAVLSIYSADGRRVAAVSLEPGEQVVDVSLPKGVYVIQLVSALGEKAISKMAIR